MKDTKSDVDSKIEIDILETNGQTHKMTIEAKMVLLLKYKLKGSMFTFLGDNHQNLEF